MMKRIAVLLILILTLTIGFTLGTATADDGVLTLPDELITIEAEAFRGITSANKVIVQDGATTIGAGAFEDGGFSEIQLPGTVTEIGANAARFDADVYDVSEMLPWIRTFICRISSVECSNKVTEARLMDDLALMNAMYCTEVDTDAVP